MLLPEGPVSVAVTVTTLALDVALTPGVAPLRLMASARFVASVVVLDEIEKFVPVSEPLTPPARVPPDQAKPLEIFSVSPIVFPAVPSVVAATGTTEAHAVDDTPQ